jgi:HK97 family phage portal protein
MIAPIARRLKQLKDAAGQFFTPIYARGRSWSLALFPGTKFDYERAVGDGLLTNVFVAPILFVARNFAQSRLGVKKIDSNGKAKIDTDHPMAKLIRRPNPFYSGLALWIATLFSWFLDGNAYWLKVRDGVGNVVELWYVPHWLIYPRGDDDNAKVFIKDYVYRPGAVPIDLKPKDVVHLRYGIDPRDPRRGYGILKAVLSVAYIDNAALNLVAAVLRNKGIGGILISPEKDVVVEDDDAQSMKDYVRSETTGDNAGNPLIMRGATKVQSIGFSPAELDLKSAHGVAEERVCAIMGLPASIVGFGTGMSQTKVGATLAEQRKLSWSDCIVPNQDMIAAELDMQLLPDFGGGETDWDRTDVDALQDDREAKSKRVMDELNRGGRDLAEAREELGLEVDDTHRGVFYIPFNVTPTKSDALIAPEPVAQPPAVPAPGQPPKPGEPPKPAPQPAKSFKHTLTPLQSGLLKAFDRMNRRMAAPFKSRVRATLEHLGDSAAHAYRAAAAKSYGAAELKDAEKDKLVVDEIFDNMELEVAKSQLRAEFGSQFVSVAHETLQVTAAAGIVLDGPDPVQVELLKRGGTRAGLVDLTEPARQKAFAILADARARGLGVDETARELREAIPAGPWGSIETRADIIARTETRYAQTMSALEIYKDAEGVEQIQMIDCRLGPSDADCENVAAMDPVSFEEAEKLLDEEHPNGTRDIVPVFGGNA